MAKRKREGMRPGSYASNAGTAAATALRGTLAASRKPMLIVAAVLLTILIVGAVVLWRLDISPSRNSAHRAPSDSHAIAVLPFENASNDPNAEYLAEGISETLINSLTELRDLRVVARATAFHYKGKEVDPQRIGRELRVTAVLSGKVRQMQDALSVQVDLIDATTGAQIWGQSYERKLSDVVAVKQGDCARSHREAEAAFSGEEERRLVQHDTLNAEAYQLYLKGRYFWNKRTEEGLEKGLGYFQQRLRPTRPTRWLMSAWLIPTTFWEHSELRSHPPET